ncbi:MAG TPA: hypothetical protein VLM85_15885 [Polyangiaceae bacterium]|nr:hypothetical protein [Polyangiaceae bacterium]
MKRLVWLVALFPLSPFACSGGGNATDAGADAAHDGTTADVHDSSPDTALDAPKDVAKDTTSDGTTSDASDASASDASDGGAGDASDASTSDASDASSSDASADAAADAADGGSSWHTPTCDGTIGSGEYGDSNYQTTSSTQTWYMTWDATNLYVALDPANVTEGTVLYVGFSGNGLTTGQTYDTTNGSLPFAADAVVYAKQGYQEIRLGSVDAGSWGTPDTTSVQFCDNNNATREEVIPWTALGASAIPASFRFLAYATSSGGSVYGQIPVSNPTGSIGTSATFGHDFLVSSTANGSGAFPFATTE